MTDSRLRPFRAMAYNNAWSNHRLLSACIGLSEPAFTATRTSFFPSLSATLNHNLTIDWFYVDALEGGSLGPQAWRDAEPHRHAAALRNAQADVDRRLIRFVEGLTPDALDRIVRIQREEAIQTERTDALLLHLFQHQIHHRGQAHAMLAGTAIAPPQLDEFFSKMDAGSRAAELVELGWREGQWWD